MVFVVVHARLCRFFLRSTTPGCVATAFICLAADRRRWLVIVRWRWSRPPTGVARRMIGPAVTPPGPEVLTFLAAAGLLLQRLQPSLQVGGLQSLALRLEDTGD